MHKDPDLRSARLGWWLLTLLVVGVNALVVFCIYDIVEHGKLAAESLTWPSVPGTVYASGVTISHGHRSATSYHADVRYRFTVGGRVFEGRGASFEGCDSTRACEAIVDTYPAGSRAEVHYRPGTPEMNVLIPGGGISYGAVAAFGFLELLIFPLTCFMLWFGVKLLLPPPSRAELRRREEARARARSVSRKRTR